MQSDSVTLHVIFRETTNRLDRLARSVRENKQVLEACDFARWLQHSGIIRLLEQNPHAAPLMVDVSIINKQIRDLIWDCGELFKNGKSDPKYAASDIAEINRKLDLIAGHIGRAIPSSPSLMATTETTGNVAEPVLQVLQGGVS